MRRLFYFAQYLILLAFMALFAVLPLDVASGIGGWMGRKIGPRLGLSRRAMQNLTRVFPTWPIGRKQETVLSMWDNLGRIVAEYPHLARIARERVTIRGGDILESTLGSGKSVIFFSAHIGNWEVNLPALLIQRRIAACGTYRALNNPFADRLLKRHRTLGGLLRAFPKSRESGRHMMTELKSGGCLAFLIDQKYNEGVESSFLGHPAMTNPIFVSLAQRYDCALVPARCRRLNGARFEIDVLNPLSILDDAGAPRDTGDVVADAHALLESWINETPAQWLWLHRRWKT